jgi:hypothetical protein
LLNEIRRLAAAAGYQTIRIEAQEDTPLGPLLAGHLRSLLYELDRLAGAGDKVRRGLRVLRSFVGGLKITLGEVSIGLDIDPETGAADSGNVEIDLPNLLEAVAEAARERGSAAALLIDEIQYFTSRELGALIMAMHRLQQGSLPMVLVGAGLPILPGLAGDAKSYAERLFAFPAVGALTPEDAAKALDDPARAHGASFTKGALAEVYRLTQGYPYFVQEWGYQSWNLAETVAIGLPDVERATATAMRRLDDNFFRVRYDRLRPGEKTFLRGMAEIGAGPHRIGAIAAVLGVKVRSLGPVRANLIRKGMVYSPAHGDLAFTVPLFDEFMKRAMPEAA